MCGNLPSVPADNESYMQPSGECPAGYAVKSILKNGSITCVTLGSGNSSAQQGNVTVTLSGAYANANQSCANNSYVSGIDANGNVICRPQAATSEQACKLLIATDYLLTKVQSSTSTGSASWGALANGFFGSLSGSAPTTTKLSDVSPSDFIINIPSDCVQYVPQGAANLSSAVIISKSSSLGTLPVILQAPDSPPTILFYDSVNKSIDEAMCGNGNCTDPIIFKLVQTNNTVFDAALGSDSGLILAYLQGNISSSEGARLAVLHCNGLFCAFGSNNSYPLIANITGSFGSLHIVVGSDGLPLIAFTAYDSGGNSIVGNIVHCVDLYCSQLIYRQQPGSIVKILYAPSLSILPQVKIINSVFTGSDGNATLIYVGERQNTSLLHCEDYRCANYVITKFSGALGGKQLTPITALMGSDGKPLLFYESLNYSVYDIQTILTALHCTDQLCNNFDSNRTVASVIYQSSLGLGTSSLDIENVNAEVGLDGNPLVSYMLSDGSSTELDVSHCTDLFCSKSTISTVDANVAYNIAMNTQGNYPEFAYHDISGNLRYKQCSTLSCQ